MEAVGIFRFNNTSSDPRCSSITPGPQDSERNEDIYFIDPNTLQRVGNTSSSMPPRAQKGTQRNLFSSLFTALKRKKK